MKASEELALLVAQERAVAPPPGAADRGWTSLQDALAAGASPVAVAVTPLKLGSTWATMKVALVPFVFGAVVGTGVMGVAGVVRNAAAPSASVTATAAASALPPVVGPPSRDDTPVVAASMVVVVPTVPPSVSVGEVRSPLSFEAELALIQRAKAALDAGRVEEARGWLDEHQRAFPQGVFASEREGLFILLACRNGASAAGRAAAREYLRRPSVLADRIQRACGLGDEETVFDK